MQYCVVEMHLTLLAARGCKILQSRLHMQYVKDCIFLHCSQLSRTQHFTKSSHFLQCVPVNLQSLQANDKKSLRMPLNSSQLSRTQSSSQDCSAEILTGRNYQHTEKDLEVLDNMEETQSVSAYSDKPENDNMPKRS